MAHESYPVHARYPDAIELYNAGSAPVDLGGMRLTDNPYGDPYRHRVPALTFVDGPGFLAFTADGDLTNWIFRIPAGTTDTDGDGIPDWREELYAAAGLNPTVSNSATSDFDLDGFPDTAEYIADTDPTDSNSFLTLEWSWVDASGAQIQWRGGRGAVQYLEKSSSLDPATADWTPALTNPPPPPVTNSTIDVDTSTGPRFYRVRAQR